jgi:hypothetical protein
MAVYINVGGDRKREVERRYRKELKAKIVISLSPFGKYL